TPHIGISAPSCRPRLVRAMSSAPAAATASSKKSSKKSPIRKKRRQPGFAAFTSRYWAITGEGAVGEISFIGDGRGLRVLEGSIRKGERPNERKEERHGREFAVFPSNWRGGRLVSRPRALSPCRCNPARGRLRHSRSISPGLARFAGGSRRAAGASAKAASG